MCKDMRTSVASLWPHLQLTPEVQAYMVLGISKMPMGTKQTGGGIPMAGQVCANSKSSGWEL